MARNAGNDPIPADLVRRARTGEDEALETLVRRAYPRVRRWALVHTGDPAEADDLTQDVLMQIVRRVGSFRGEADFTSWLYAITRNAALDGARSRSRRSRLHRDPLVDADIRPSPPPPPDRRVERTETAGILERFLRELPQRQREAVELVDLEGLDSAEAGRRMGIAAVSVRAHLHKARRTLRALVLEHRPELAREEP